MQGYLNPLILPLIGYDLRHWGVRDIGFVILRGWLAWALAGMVCGAKPAKHPSRDCLRTAPA
jgi:hypothetical protein